MKLCRGAGAFVVALCFLLSAAGGQETEDPQALSERAGKAEAAGDRVTALRLYTEAVNSLRKAGAPPEKCAPYMIERDRLAAAIIADVAKSAKLQRQTLVLQQEINKKLNRITQADSDIQARVKNSEDRIKNIETELLDAVK